MRNSNSRNSSKNNSNRKQSIFCKDNLPYIIISAIAIVHLLITFTTDKTIFTVSPLVNLMDYILCKIITFMVLWLFYYGLYLVFIHKDRKKSILRRSLVAAFPYLLVMIVICIFKLRNGFISGDETTILNNALTLTHYIWFTYITTYYYIVSMMLIPCIYAAVITKVIIEYIIIGYIMVRTIDYFKRNQNTPILPVKWITYGGLIILLFFFYPILAYTPSAHRLPIYLLFYILMVTVLLFDKLSKESLTLKKALVLLLLGSILTQWRTEGIYLIVLLPILMLFSYENLRHLKPFAALLVCYIAIQYAISIPQNGATADELSSKAEDRMKPFYAYTITNMFRNGLDFSKNGNDLEIVDKYIALENLIAINENLGDANYEDIYILFESNEYYGVRPEATITDSFNFISACKNIFINNPDVFIRTRINAFIYSALPYHIELPTEGINALSLVKVAVSTIKVCFYNLFIPLGIAIVLCLYSLFRKRWFTFFLFGGVLAHWFIVFILAPASYFKYYFPVYITSYFYVILLLIQFIYNRKNSVKAKILV